MYESQGIVLVQKTPSTLHLQKEKEENIKKSCKHCKRQVAYYKESSQ